MNINAVNSKQKYYYRQRQYSKTWSRKRLLTLAQMVEHFAWSRRWDSQAFVRGDIFLHWLFKNILSSIENAWHYPFIVTCLLWTLYAKMNNCHKFNTDVALLYWYKMSHINNSLTLVAWGETKWPPFSRLHFQRDFHERKYMNFDEDITKVCSQGSN